MHWKPLVRLVSSLLSQAIFEIISMFKRWLIVGDRNVLTPPIKLKNMVRPQNTDHWVMQQEVYYLPALKGILS